MTIFSEAEPAIERILTLVRTTSPVVVAVDGRSGSGKSTLAKWMADRLGALHIDQDDFYSGGELEEWRSLSAREKADRVIDWRRVRAEVLEPLRAGQPARWHPFDWETMQGLARGSITAQPKTILILDGAYSSRPELADLIDLSILVHLPDALRLERLRQREGEDVTSTWQSIWDEAEEHYFGIVRPPHAFDLVIHRPAD